MSTSVIVVERMNKMREMVADVLEVELSEITDTSDFQKDHEADSLRAIEILARIEEEYNVEIPQDKLARMTNLTEVYEVVKEYAAWDE
jgi:acyl carrier protein